MKEFDELLAEVTGTRYHPMARRGSYDYTDPTDYVRKSDRASVTGEYRREWPASQSSNAVWAKGSNGARYPKSAKRRRGSGR